MLHLFCYSSVLGETLGDLSLKAQILPQTLLSIINLWCWVISRTYILKKCSDIIILLSPSSHNLLCLLPLRGASRVLFATFFDDGKLKACMTWYFWMPRIEKKPFFFTSKKILFLLTQTAKQGLSFKKHKHIQNLGFNTHYPNTIVSLWSPREGPWRPELCPNSIFLINVCTTYYLAVTCTCLFCTNRK